MTPDVLDYVKRVPFFRFLDFSVLELEESHVLATMPFADRLIGNPVMERYHGGIIASFMEALAAISVWNGVSTAPPKPINLTVDYLRPAVRGALTAKALVTRKGRRMASVRTVSWQTEESQLVAEGVYHFLLV